MKIACVQIKAYDCEDWHVAVKDAFAGIDEASSNKADLALLPEMVWPGYVIGRFLEQNSYEEIEKLSEHVMGLFSQKAREKSMGVCVGLLRAVDGKFYNSAVLFGPDGQVLGSADKMFLWHFDSQFVSPGKNPTAVDTPWGKVGMAICADARIPEVIGSLAQQGAWLILDCVNLVSSGASLVGASNPQIDFMLPCRALENGVWVACANKTGVERDSVVYCGKSSVYSPQGKTVVQCVSHEAGIVYADVEEGVYEPLFRPSLRTLLECERKGLGYNADRLPWLYLGVLQADLEDLDLPLWMDERLYDLHTQGAKLVCCPNLGRRVEEVLPVLLKRSAQHSMTVVLPGVGVCLDGVFCPEGEDNRYQIRLEFWGSFVAFQGMEGLDPDVVRMKALDGAQVMLWAYDGLSREEAVAVARTRAAENKVFVVLCADAESGGSSVFDPSGAQLCRALDGRRQAVGAMIVPALAGQKMVVPGTDASGGICAF